LSDHTSGIIVASSATLMGASIIEKHISLDRTMKGTDQSASLEEAGLKKLINYIRAIESSLGTDEKEFNKDSLSAKNKLARSITTKNKIKKGQLISEKDLCLKSPGSGYLWRDKGDIIGKIAKVDIDKDITITSKHFE